MATRLGIELRPSGLRAALAVDSDIVPIDFDADGAELPLAAHVGEDGEVLVGDAAISEGERTPAGLLQNFHDRIADPRRYQVNGHAVSAPLLLAHLLTEVVARSIHTGHSPDAIVLAHADSLDDAAIAGVAAAADLAELELEQMVPRSAVATPGVDAATGAALLGSVPPIIDPTATRLLTKEDLEGPAAAPAPPPAEPRYETVGPPTVFEETTTLPVVAPATQGDPAVTTAAGMAPQGPNNQRALIAGIGGAVAAAVVIAGLVWLLTRSGDDDVASTSSSTSLPIATTSSTPASTTIPESTVTTSIAATSSTSSTSTTTSTTTTTIPRIVGDASLSAVGLVLNPGRAGETTVALDTDADDAIGDISAVLGSPDADSGWELEELCDADESRFVRYGDLEIVLFATIEVIEVEVEPPEPDPDADPPEEDPPLPEPVAEVVRTETFGQWFVETASGNPADLYLFGDLLGIGDTVGTFNNVLGNDLTVGVSGERGVLSIRGPGGRTIDGLATGPTASDTVTQLWAGSGCDRGF